MNRRLSAAAKFTLLLFVASSVFRPNFAQERKNGAHEVRRPLTTAAAPVLASAGKFLDSGLIAFSTGEHIYVMNSDGSGLRPVTGGIPGSRYTHPALSPDARTIAFISNDGTSEHILYLVGIDGTGLQRLTSRNIPLAEPAWSPDGSQIAYVQGFDTTVNGVATFTACAPEIYVIDIASGKEASLTLGAGGTDPAWSPDATRIAFSSMRDGNYEIYTTDLKGDKVQRLTHTDWSEAEPAWSPDGGRIAYVAHLVREDLACGFMPTGGTNGGELNGAASSVYLMNADGSGQAPLAGTVGATELSWSPSGVWLALALNIRGDAQVYVADVWGRSKAKLTSDPAPKSSPSWVRSQTAPR